MRKSIERSSRPVDRRQSRLDQSGQTTIEYIAILAIVAVVGMTVIRGLTRARIFTSLTQPLRESFKATYQYGHPKAKGPDDGGPDRHPRYYQPSGSNFRIFSTPEEWN